MKILYYSIEKQVNSILRNISFNDSLDDIFLKRLLGFLDNDKTLNKDKIYIYILENKYFYLFRDLIIF